MLAAKAAVDALCARHGLERSDIQAHIKILGLDVDTIDADAVHVKKVERHRLCIASTHNIMYLLILGMADRMLCFWVLQLQEGRPARSCTSPDSDHGCRCCKNWQTMRGGLYRTIMA